MNKITDIFYSWTRLTLRYPVLKYTKINFYLIAKDYHMFCNLIDLLYFMLSEDLLLVQFSYSKEMQNFATLLSIAFSLLHT